MKINIPMTNEEINTDVWRTRLADVVPELVKSTPGPVIPDSFKNNPLKFEANPDCGRFDWASGRYPQLDATGFCSVGLKACILLPKGSSIHSAWQSYALYEQGNFVGWGEWIGDLRYARDEDSL